VHHTENIREDFAISSALYVFFSNSLDQNLPTYPVILYREEVPVFPFLLGVYETGHQKTRLF